MRGIFPFVLVPVLSAILTFSPFRAFSQEFLEEYLDPLSRKTTAEYLKAVDVLSLDDIRSVSISVWKHGLNPRKYWNENMEKIYQRGDAQKFNLKTRANQNFLQLLNDLSIGVVDPESLTYDIKLKRKKFLTPKQLQALIVSTGQKADLLVDSLAPQNEPYLSLKKGLEKVYAACMNKEWVPLTPAKKVLKLGVKDPAVPNLKKHLAFLGYPITSQDDVIDSETVKAINDIEWNMRIKPDSTIHPGGPLWKFLRVPCVARVNQIQADMEKLRWFPRQFGDRYVFINLAMSYFVLADKTQNPPYFLSFRTINGRFERKSPTMQDRIVRVIINPYWVVPPTIFIEDKVKEIRTLPPWKIREYFDSHHYEVWNKSFTRKLNPESINWWAFDANLDASIYIRQRPNYMNALGVLKFELTNSFSVYLHDTNQRELFYDPFRLISSGCIRLEKPFELAEYLLKGSEWNRVKIENSTAQPGQVMPRDTPIELANPIPVYTAFLTSFFSSDGVLRFTEDGYYQNPAIIRRLNGY